MQAETQASLDQSRAYLRDCVEASHLMLKRKLEALRRGEEIDWRETRDILREGRNATRQLTQIASLELRDRQQSAREGKVRRMPRGDAPKLKVQPTPEMTMRFLNGIMEWQKLPPQGDLAPPLPDDLRKLITELGLNPDDAGSFDVLFEYFESVTSRQAA